MSSLAAMRTATLLTLLLAVAGPVAGKELTLHQHVTGRGFAVESYDTTEYLTPELRVVDGPHNRTVIDAKARTVTVLDKDDHTFWQTSFESLHRETEEMATSKHNFDPQGRLPVTLEPTGVTGTIAGHPVAEYRLQSKQPSGSVWLAKDLEPPADPTLWLDWPGLGTRLGPNARVADAALARKGVPLRSTLQVGGAKISVTITTEVTAVREEAPPSDIRAIPEGYTHAPRHAFGR